MKLSFAGFDHAIELPNRGVTVLQIENIALYTRICQSLLSGKGEQSLESYSVWDDDGSELNPSRWVIPVENVFDLPWKHKRFLGSLHDKLDLLLLEDEDLRGELQDLSSRIESAVFTLSSQLNSDCSFGVEWNMRDHLKTFSFGVDLLDATSLFDNLMSFIDLAADIVVDEVILFINLKTFLTKNELVQLYERAFFLGIRILLLENRDAEIYSDYEKKIVVDQHFIEYEMSCQSDCSSFCRKEFAPTVLVQ